MKKTLFMCFLILSMIFAFGSVAVAQDAVTLLWGMWGSPEEIATHQAVADAYMAQNPNVTIELWSQPWGDYFTKLDTLFAAGDATAIPDVFFLSPVPSYAARDVLQPLDSFIEESGLDLADYWPGAIESTVSKPKVRMIHAATDPSIGVLKISVGNCCATASCGAIIMTATRSRNRIIRSRAF